MIVTGSDVRRLERRKRMWEWEWEYICIYLHEVKARRGVRRRGAEKKRRAGKKIENRCDKHRCLSGRIERSMVLRF